LFCMPLSALEHLVGPPLVDTQLKHDFLLCHLRRPVEFADPPRTQGGSFVWREPAP
jgi:hypothetical protein